MNLAFVNREPEWSELDAVSTRHSKVRFEAIDATILTQ